MVAVYTDKRRLAIDMMFGLIDLSFNDSNVFWYMCQRECFYQNRIDQNVIVCFINLQIT